MVREDPGDEVDGVRAKLNLTRETLTSGDQREKGESPLVFSSRFLFPLAACNLTRFETVEVTQFVTQFVTPNIVQHMIQYTHPRDTHVHVALLDMVLEPFRV